MVIVATLLLFGSSFVFLMGGNSAWLALATVGVLVFGFAHAIRKFSKWHRENSEKMESKKRLASLILTGAACLSQLRKILTPALVIDSNIWMNDGYDNFFTSLKLATSQSSYVFSLHSIQFDEISNIKKRRHHDDESAWAARIALARIEDFQKAGLLKIHKWTLDANPHAYADPWIIKSLAASARSGVPSTFISDDRELRVRVRQALSECAEADWAIIDMEDLQNGCDAICEAQTMGHVWA